MVHDDFSLYQMKARLCRVLKRKHGCADNESRSIFLRAISHHFASCFCSDLCGKIQATPP